MAVAVGVPCGALVVALVAAAVVRKRRGAGATRGKELHSKPGSALESRPEPDAGGKTAAATDEVQVIVRPTSVRSSANDGGGGANDQAAI